MNCPFRTPAALIGACAMLMLGPQAFAQDAAASAATPGEAAAPAVPTAAKKPVKLQGHHAKSVAQIAGADSAKKSPVPASAASGSVAAAAPNPPAQAATGVAQAPVSATPPTGEFDPVVHARSAKIGVCMDNIVGQSGRVIDRPHQAASTWVTSAPDENVFQSIVSLSYPNKQMPNAAAVILAAPIGANKCQGQSVQIFPTARSCTAVQASLIQIGKTIATLENLPLVQLKDGSRNLLMPTAGGGCVVITVQLRQ